MNEKIPKVIHYVWLGGNRLNKTSQKCLNSWSAFLPEYKIVKWDERNALDIINAHVFARQAYECKKYAFVSDYLRLFLLYYYGGIYMDTDVEVTKPLDEFLGCGAFSSFESTSIISTGLIGARKGNRWIKSMLDYYQDRKFILPDKTLNTRPNTQIISELSLAYGFVPNDQFQILEEDVHIYPKEYFCPIDPSNSKFNCFTENTHAIHYFDASWYPLWRRIASKIKKRFRLNPEHILGKKLYNKLKT